MAIQPFYVIILAVFASLFVHSTKIINSTRKCPVGWKPFGSKCYVIFSENTTSSVSFDKAKLACRNISPKSTLVSIQSNLEQEFLVLYYGAFNVTNDIWIGLESQSTQLENGSKSTTSVWDDGSTVDFWNNKIYEDTLNNSLAMRSCYYMKYYDYPAGRWHRGDCENKLKGFLCQIDTGSTIESEVHFGTVRCPHGFKAYKDNCYWINSKATDWKSAERECQKHESHLAYIPDPYVEKYIEHLSRNFERKSIWIGLNNLSNSWFSWSNGKPIYHTWWNDNEPSNDTSRQCVSKHSSTFWTMEDCSLKLPFICTKIVVPESANRTHVRHFIRGTCPINWVDVGNEYCYYLSTRNEGWDYVDANDFCSSGGKNGSVAVFHSDHDVMLLRPHLVRHPGYFLMGIRRNSNGSFLEVNSRRTVEYLPWDDHQPGFGHCIFISVPYLKYSTRKCEEISNIICQAEKILNKEETQGFFETILSILIVAGVVAAAYALCFITYYCYNKKGYKIKALLNSPSANPIYVIDVPSTSERKEEIKDKSKCESNYESQSEHKIEK